VPGHIENRLLRIGAWLSRGSSKGFLQCFKEVHRNAKKPPQLAGSHRYWRWDGQPGGHWSLSCMHRAELGCRSCRKRSEHFQSHVAANLRCSVAVVSCMLDFIAWHARMLGTGTVGALPVHLTSPWTSTAYALQKRRAPHTSRRRSRSHSSSRMRASWPIL
jgi:hypothetical protein